MFPTFSLQNAGRPKHRGLPHVAAPTRGKAATYVLMTDSALKAKAKKGDRAAKRELARRKKSLSLRATIARVGKKGKKTRKGAKTSARRTASAKSRSKTRKGARKGKARSILQLNWNDFQKANKGKKLSQKQLGAKFKRGLAGLGDDIMREMGAARAPKGKGKGKSRGGKKGGAKRYASKGLGSGILGSLDRAAARAAAPAKAAKAKAKASLDAARMAEKKRLRAKGLTPIQIQKAMASNNKWASAHLAAANPFGGLALTNRGRKHFGALALENSSLVLHPSQLVPSVEGYKSAAMDWAAMVPGVALGAGAHAWLSASGWTASLQEQVEQVPVIGDWVIPGIDQTVPQLLPFSIQGALAGVAVGVAAGLAPAGHVRNILAATAGSALAFGVGLDAFNFVSGWAAGQASEADLQAAELSELVAPSRDSSLAGLALQNVSALGDGFAYTLAPLQAQTTDFGQASFGDAFYSGIDFSPGEVRL